MGLSPLPRRPIIRDSYAGPSPAGTSGGTPVETIIGLVLILLSAAIIFFIIRTVQANART